MKLFVSASVLVLASSLAAYAQGTGTPTAPSAPPAPSATEQCWDLATNSVKNSQDQTLSQGANSSPGTAANPTTSPKDSMAQFGTNQPPAPGGSATATRPPGMPTC